MTQQEKHDDATGNGMTQYQLYYVRAAYFMKIRFLATSFLIILILTGCGKERNWPDNNVNMKNNNIRPAAVAGKFYSASSDVLEKEQQQWASEVAWP